MSRQPTTSRAKSPRSATGTRDKHGGAAVPLEFEGSHEVLVLQFSAPDPLPDIDVDAFAAMCIADVLHATKRRPRAKTTWSFWLATERPDVSGCTFWLGINKPGAAAVADRLQERLQDAGCRVVRAHVAIASAGLRPILYVDADGAALPERAPASVEDAVAWLGPTRRVFRVGLLECWKRDLLARLMLGNDTAPILSVPYYGDDEQAEFVLGRVDLQMFVPQRDGLVLAAARASEAPPAVWTFEFPVTVFSNLIALLDESAQELLLGPLSEGRPARLPAGTCVVGIRATALPRDPDGSRSYAVRSLFAPTAKLMAAEF